jgi:predicted nucleic acid-binding protein
MRYLVDTDWIIDGLGGRETALAWFEEHRDEGLGVLLLTRNHVHFQRIPDLMLCD